MPKMKTKRAAAKRYKLTGTGKVKVKRNNLRHILTKASSGTNATSARRATSTLRILTRRSECFHTASIGTKGKRTWHG